MDTGNLFQAFRISASGLSAQRARLNVISSNIANAQTTRTPEGGAYKRRIVTIEGDGSGGRSSLFERLLHATRSLSAGLQKTSPRHLDQPAFPTFPGSDPNVAFSVGVDEETPTRFEYEPGHPDANEDGYVEYPNVEVVKEMVDLMTASRAYEANVTVLNSTKAMLRKALEI